MPTGYYVVQVTSLGRRPLCWCSSKDAAETQAEAWSINANGTEYFEVQWIIRR